MRRPYQITAVLCLALAVFVGWNAVRLRYYTSLGPGPGFFPLWLAILCGGLALAMLAQSTFRPVEAAEPGFYPNRAGALRVGAIALAIFVAAFVVEDLGFRLTMLAFNVAMLLTFGRRGWIEMTLVAVAGSFGVHYVFAHVLSIPLPEGIF